MRSQKNANKTGLFFSPNCKCFSNKTEYVQNRVRVFRIKRTEGFNFTGVTFTIGECFRTTRYAKQQKCYFSVKKTNNRIATFFNIFCQFRSDGQMKSVKLLKFLSPRHIAFQLCSRKIPSRENLHGNFLHCPLP